MNLDEEFNPYAKMNDNMSEEQPIVFQDDVEEIHKEVKVKKTSGKFKKAFLYTISAVVLGCVAGGACYGVSYAGYKIFPVGESKKTETKIETPSINFTDPSQGASTVVNTTTNISATVLDVSDIVKEVITSIVQVTGTMTKTSQSLLGNQTYKSKVSGSGIIMGTTETEILIVTNAHVVEDVDNLTITLYDGTEISGTVKGMKSSYDLAVISVKKSDIPDSAIYSFAKLGESSEIEVGNAAIAVGNSMGYGISVTTGCISALNKSVKVENTVYNNLIQTDAAINPGNSGGALFNAAGEVIGINSVKMKTTGVEGMGYAISVSSVKEIIEELSTKEEKEKLEDDERGFLGITGVSITDDISAQYGYPTGVLVRTVTEGSGAEKAGIEEGDIIKTFDGEKMKTFDQLYALMYYYPVGETVEVVYYRLNSAGTFEERTVEITLTERPKS